MPFTEVRRVDTRRQLTIAVNDVLPSSDAAGERQQLTLEGIRELVGALAQRFGKYRITLELQPSIIQNLLDSFATTVLYQGSAITFRPAKNVELEVRPVRDARQEKRVEPGLEAEADENYGAYLADVPELRRTLPGHLVAYFNGQRVASGQDMQELIDNIPAEIRRERLFINPVSPAPIKFRRPFFRHKP